MAQYRCGRRVLFALATVFLLAASISCRADGFVFAVESPNFTVRLPHVPSMSMAVHPKYATQPHLRYLGSEGPYAVSVFTPAAAAGMSAAECASAILRSMASRKGVPPPAEMYKARLNDTTFLAIYGEPLPGAVRLHAHVLSGTGTHCIEVQVSKISESEDELQPWLNGFDKAVIELR